MSRFAQADTVIPSPGCALAWDRYALANNNPLYNTDPSGNKPCDTEDCRNKNRREVLLEELSNTFHWFVDNSFSISEIGTIFNSANDIYNYVNSLTNGNGYSWMKAFIGSAYFVKDTVFTDILNVSGFVYPGNLIHLADGYNSPLVAHEVGHLIDNNIASLTRNGFVNAINPFFNDASFIGSGPADAMISALGGNPALCIPRFYCGNIIGEEKYLLDISGNSTWQKGAYSNRGTAEDFAMTFEYATYQSNSVPSLRLIWMNAFISVSGIY